VAPTTLASDLVEVVLEPDPWSVEIRAGGTRLSQGAPFGFLEEGRWSGPDLPPDDDPPEPSWFRVTRVAAEREKSSGFYDATLDTDQGHTARVQVRIVDEGAVSVKVSAEGAAVCEQSFTAESGERFLGFGERSHAASLDRGVIENYVGEGPYQPHEYAFLTGIVPPWGLRNRPDATYYPVPWVLSTRGYGVLIDHDEVSYARFRSARADRWSIEVEAGALAFTFFAGPTPLDALARFSAASGRQPAPSRWWFGPWYQSGHANHIPLAEETRQADILRDSAVSAVETHCRYLPLGEDRGYEDSEKARTAFFHSRGWAALSYINPLVGRDYTEVYRHAERRQALLQNAEGQVHLFEAYAGGREPPSAWETQYDFTSAGAMAAWGAVAGRITGNGYDGWMEDFGEYTPLDAVQADGSTGTAGHNRYPTSYHQAAASATAAIEAEHRRRMARFVRSGWTGTARFAPIVWGGDPTTSWGFDGLSSAVTEGLSMGASGVAMWGSDTGGFLSSLDRLTPELLIRWIQFSAFCPVMRTKAGGIEIPAYERPQIWDDDILPAWRHWAAWHTQLNDYLMAAHATYRRTGRPIMCALELEYPDMGPVPDQYLLGTDLLVAPVLQPGATSRPVVLPPGPWWELFGRARRFEGPARVDVAVGPDDIPVLVRGGAVIGLLPEGTKSLSPYGPALSHDREVLVFPEPGVEGGGQLGPDHRYRTTWTGDHLTLDLDGPAPARWQVNVARAGGPPVRHRRRGQSVTVGP
jgi:alpha-glucosidase (family GH31 glycosyl hydrolase)